MPKPIPQVYLVVVTTDARLGFNLGRFFTLLSVAAAQQPTDTREHRLAGFPASRSAPWLVDQRSSRSAPWLVCHDQRRGAEQTEGHKGLLEFADDRQNSSTIVR